MKFQIVSEVGAGVGIATHLSSEGHAVVLQVEIPNVGSGVARHDSSTTQADIVLFDSNVYGQQADSLREKGQRVAGSSVWGELVESDKTYTHALARTLGWNIDPAVKGDEFCISGLFNGVRYLGVCVSILYREVYHRDEPSSCEYSGVLSDFWIDKGSKTYSEILNPLSRLLKKVNHRGLFNVFVRANRESYTIRGVNTSLTSPLGYVFYENCRHTMSDVLIKLFDEASQALTILERFSGSLLVSTTKKSPIPGINLANLKHLWLQDVEYSNGTWMAAYEQSRVGYITSRGSTINEVCKRLYRTAKNIHTPSLQYRDDLGQGIHKVFSSLTASGWIKDKSRVTHNKGGYNVGSNNKVSARKEDVPDRTDCRDNRSHAVYGNSHS